MTQINQYTKGRLYRYLISVMVVFLAMTFLMPGLRAQSGQKPVTVFGTVTDDKKVPVMGAVVQITESTRLVVTDESGNFEIEVPSIGSTINIEADGFDPQTVTVTGTEMTIILIHSVEGQGIRDRVYLPWAVSDRRSVTASVATITHEELRKSPVMSLSRAVSGRLPGFTVLQTSGEPGFSSESWRIRGNRTLESGGMNNMSKGGYGAPIAVVDGVERSFTDFDASEIESFSILKDAAATNIYGLRGANGVIFITTKRGQENKRTIDFEMSSGIVAPTRLPKYLGSFDYARLFNEARRNDGLAPVYTGADLALYKSGANPLTHPDNDYYGEFLKPYALQSKMALTLSGGNKLARYFVAMSYNNEGSLYDRTDENPDFATRSNYSRFNTRVNLDISITPRLTAVINIAGRLEMRNYPYSAESTVWGLLSNLPPNAFPLSFPGIDPGLKKEIFMLGGTSVYQSNPLGELSYRGFTKGTRRYYQLGVGLNYDLGFITEGLVAGFMLDADGYNLYNVSRYQTYSSWAYVEGGDNIRYKTPSSLTVGTGWNANSWDGLNLNLRYDKSFGESNVKAFAMMRRFRQVNPQANQPDLKNEDFVLRLNYSFKNRYYVEATGTYSSNDNIYLTEVPRVFLPVISGGWIISDEGFLSGLESLNLLKIRASHGLTANDWYTFTDPNNLRYRFPYRNRYWTSGWNTAWGISLRAMPNSAYEGAIPNLEFTAEKGRMTNIGIDARFLSNRLSLTSDLWVERRFDIYTSGEGTIPQAFGALTAFLPITNEGIVDSKGFEIQLGWNDKVGAVSYWINGMFDMSRNKIVYMTEPTRDYPYQVETGGPVRQDWGLIALGLFKNQADVDNSPVQTFGAYQAGDIKYKDLNGDNIIDVNDLTSIGQGRWPLVSYAMDMGLKIGQFDFSMLWQGSTEFSHYLSSNYFRPFTSNGSISEYALDRHRVAPGYENATFPRLSTLYSDNNLRISTFWLQDITYIRLRNLEIGYNVSGIRAEKLGLHGIRVYVNAYNLLTFDNFKTLDPEDPSAGVSSYPMTKVTNMGLILKF